MLSSAIGLCLLQKIQFNFFAALKKGGIQVPIDKWQIMDIIFASTSLTQVLLIASFPDSLYKDPVTKHNISYIVAIVSVFQYIRVFAYFLVISSVSKMLLTLYMMILDTLAFILLLVIWTFIMSVVFTTLF